MCLVWVLTKICKWSEHFYRWKLNLWVPSGGQIMLLHDLEHIFCVCTLTLILAAYICAQIFLCLQTNIGIRVCCASKYNTALLTDYRFCSDLNFKPFSPLQFFGVSPSKIVGENLGIAAFFFSLLGLITTSTILTWLYCQRFGGTMTTSNTASEGKEHRRAFPES